MKAKIHREGFRVDIRMLDAGGVYQPHTADSSEEWYARAIMADLKRVGQPGRLVKVVGKAKFPSGEVIETWEKNP